MKDAKNVYHEGEIALQERAGSRDMAAKIGNGIETAILLRARPFLAQQELLVLATGDAGGEVWASVWFGARGFAQSQDDGLTLAIDRRMTSALEVDPVAERLQPGCALGVLAIELESRRRLRMNGTVSRFDESSLELEIRESFPNCPKYIVKRHLRPRAPAPSPEGPRTARGSQLDAERIATISRSDTLFVASLHPTRGADASHRGGDPGFVRVLSDHTLRIPDYAGNGMFQTLGNLHSTGRAGIVFLDFDGRRLLHVTGTTTLHFDQDEAALVTGGTGRSWDLEVTRWLEGALPASADAELLERSPFVPRS